MRCSGPLPQSTSFSENFCVTWHNDLSNGSVFRNDTTTVIGRQTRGRPMDCRTPKRFRTFWCTTRPPSGQVGVVEVIRSTTVRTMLFRAFPYTTCRTSSDATCGGEKAKTGRSVAVPRGLLKLFLRLHKNSQLGFWDRRWQDCRTLRLKLETGNSNVNNKHNIN